MQWFQISKFVFVLFTLTLGEITFAQSNSVDRFYKLQSEAKYKLVVEKDTNALVRFYEEIVNQKIIYHPQLDFDFASNLGILYQYKYSSLARKMLKIHLEMGLSLEQVKFNVENTENFKGLISDSLSQKILEQYDSLHRKYISNLDLNRLFQIAAISERDFFCRELYFSNFVKQWKNKNEPEKKLANELMAYTDSLNAISFYEYIVNNGFPIFNQVGQTSTFIIVLMHNFTSCRDYIIGGESYYSFIDSVLLEQVNVGNFSNKTYAYLIDRSRNDICKLPVMYATRSYLKKKEPIFDIRNLDKRRAEIYLPPLWVDALTYGFDLPADYPLPPDCHLGN